MSPNDNIVLVSDEQEVLQTSSALLGELGFRSKVLIVNSYQDIITLCGTSLPRGFVFKTEWYYTYGLMLTKMLKEAGCMVRKNSDFSNPWLPAEEEKEVFVVSIDTFLFRLFDAKPANRLKAAAIRRILDFHGLRTQVGNNLSATEFRVLKALSCGKSYRAISVELGVSMETVKTHLKAIYRKLEVNNSAAAVSIAFQNGLV